MTHGQQVQSCSLAGLAGTPEAGWARLSAAIPDRELGEMWWGGVRTFLENKNLVIYA